MDGPSWEFVRRIKEMIRAVRSLRTFLLEFSIPRWRKSEKEGRRPAGLSEDLVVKLKCKK